jgi:hypothetical protein
MPSRLRFGSTRELSNNVSQPWKLIGGSNILVSSGHLVHPVRQLRMQGTSDLL